VTVSFIGGMIVSGSGTNNTVEFDNGSYSQSSLGPLAKSQWYRVQSPEGTLIGTLFANVPEVGMWTVADSIPAGVYRFVATAGEPACTADVGPWLPIIPFGVRKTAAEYRPWLSRFGLGTANLSAIPANRFDNAWLLDQNPSVFVAGNLKIGTAAFSAEGLAASFVLRAIIEAGETEVSSLNGRLVLMGAPTLSGPFEEVADLSSEVISKQFSVPLPMTFRFFKLAVDFPDE